MDIYEPIKRIRARLDHLDQHRDPLVQECARAIRLHLETIAECVDAEEDDESGDHEGCECAHCGEIILSEEDGTSSPHGSMHIGCADEHEAENPDDW